jgi:tetratricopeptide (TPR) repeat protein
MSSRYRQPFSRLRVLAATLSLVGMATSGAVHAQDLTTAASPGGDPRPKVKRLLPSGPRPLRQKMAPEAIAERLKHSTCFIVFIKGGKYRHHGTGWVLDIAERLIVTNHHVVDGDGPPDSLLCFFPVSRNGEWVTDPVHYLQNGNLACRGTVIASTAQHDLALLQLDRIPAGIKPLPIAARSAAPGSQLHSVASLQSGTQTMWTYTFGRVRGVGLRDNAFGHRTRMIECQMAINQGNSGGAIVNDYGDVVGVVEGGAVSRPNSPVNDVTFHVDVLQLTGYLKSVRNLVDANSAERLFLRGKGHFLNRRYDQATADLSAAIRLDSRYSAAYTQRGLTFLQQKNLDSALGDFNDALRLDSADSAAYSGRGQVYARKGKHLDAVKEFSNAIRFNANRDADYHRRGKSYQRLKQISSAYTDFVKAAELDPGYAPYHCDSGIAARLLGKYDDSLKHLETALSKRKYHRYVNQSGLTLLKMNRHQDALKAFLAANSLRIEQTRTASPVYLYNAGFAAEKLQAWKLAIAAYTEGISLNSPDRGINADLYHRRGLLRKRLGENEKAAADLAMAAKLDPKSYGNRSTKATRVKGGLYQSLAGMWKFDGTKLAKQVPVVAVASFTAQGSFHSAFAVRDQSGQVKKTQETGTYEINGDSITFTAKNTSRSRKFTFEKGVLWVQFEGWWIPFTRAKS